MPKIQFYANDLAAILNAGTITDMFVVLEGGKQILRLECSKMPSPVKTDNYKTVKASGSKKSVKSQERREPARQPRGPDVDNDAPVGLGGNLMKGVKEKWANKSPPPWMKGF